MIIKDHYTDLSSLHFRGALVSHPNAFHFKQQKQQYYLCCLPFHHTSDQPAFSPAIAVKVSESPLSSPQSSGKGRTRSSDNLVENKAIDNTRLFQNNLLVTHLINGQEIPCGTSRYFSIS